MNLFHLPAAFGEEELFEPLIPDCGVLIERIISKGQVTPQGQWYDQERDEWVALLQGQATLSFEDGRILNMREGDFVLIAAHEKHRVEHTSTDPACIWLAVHGALISRSVEVSWSCL